VGFSQVRDNPDVKENDAKRRDYELWDDQCHDIGKIERELVGPPGYINQTPSTGFHGQSKHEWYLQHT